MSNHDRVRTVAAGLLLAGALAGSLATAQELTFSGGKGHWSWNGPIASTDFNHGISLNVLFVPESGCNDALFVLKGNEQVRSLSFTIDGQGYHSVAVESEYLDDGQPVVGFVLSEAAVYDLKHGYRLIIDTNAGRLNTDLSGSALAFNNAYQNCLYQIAPPTLQATPPRQTSPQATAHAAPRSSAQKLSVVEGEAGTQILFFEGDFESGDGQRLIEALRETGAPLLVLTSGGGLVSEAQMVGYYLRSNNVNTLAAGLCASACTFALAGGVERGAVEHSRIGIHRTSLLSGQGTLEDGQQIMANYLRYFRSMNVDPELVALAGSVSSDRMRWLSMNEAMQLGLIQQAISMD